ncbi:hypothetical protein BDV93DRAFT_524838 [Ceratobasidium sp. AG-I]|nr:hypothetical protein BDV93DRAFT_524838 [Ceratobasidium sp. AG-I]
MPVAWRGWNIRRDGIYIIIAAVRPPQSEVILTTAMCILGSLLCELYVFGKRLGDGT